MSEFFVYPEEMSDYEDEDQNNISETIVKSNESTITKNLFNYSNKQTKETIIENSIIKKDTK